MDNKLTILWTNADPLTAEMWGATAKLVAENKQIQEKLLNIKSKGVNLLICF